MAIFPQDMLNKQEMSLESIAGKLIWFNLQLHMIHWQTPSYAEHQAMNLYDTVHDFTDTFIEKLMGYTGRKITDLKLSPIASNASAFTIVRELIAYSDELSKFAKLNNYSDLDNMAQELSGNAAQVLFLLTLS